MQRRDFLRMATAGLAAAGIRIADAQSQVVIGHDAPFEPFSYVEGGESKGMIIEAVAEVMKRAGRPFTFRPLALDGAEGALAAGAVDALAAKGVTAERKGYMDFSSPLIITGGAAFARLGVAAETDLSAYAGMTLVTPQRGPLAGDIRRRFPAVKLLTVSSYDASLEAVLDGRADVAALNFQVGRRLVNSKYPGRFSMPAQPYLALPLAFAVAKGRNTALLAAFDHALTELKANGTIDHIYERWLKS